MSANQKRTPRTRWDNDQDGGRNADGSPQVSIRRVAYGVVAVLCPIGVALGWVLRLIVSREVVWRRVSGRLVLAVGVLAAVVLVYTVGLAAYFDPVRDLWNAVRGARLGAGGTTAEAVAANADRPTLGHALSSVVQERWLSWVWAQLPLSACVGVIRAGWAMARLQWFAPKWKTEAKPELAELSDRKRRKVERNDARTFRAERAEDLTGADVDFKKLQMPYGVSAAGKPVRLVGQHFLAHILLLGPTGMGKTTSMMRVLYGWLVDWKARRLGAVVFDFKASPDLLAGIQSLCERTGRRLHVVTVRQSPTTYNPLAHGDVDEVASRIINMLDNARDGGFTEPYYFRRGTRWLLACITALDNLAAHGVMWDSDQGRRPFRRDLPDLAEVVSIAGLRKRLPKLEGTAGRDVGKLLAEIAPAGEDKASVAARSAAQHDLGGMIDGIKLLAETAAGQVMIEAKGGVDLEKVIKAGDVVVFSLAAADDMLSAQAIGNLALADLTSVFARLEKQSWSATTGRRALIVLEEFGALGGEVLVNLYERSRSAGGTLLVSAQDDANLIDVSETFYRKVTGNSLLHLLHQQYGDTAETHGKAIGTEDTWKETIQVTEDASLYGSEHQGSGVGSLRETKEFRVHPDELKKLQAGEQIVFSRSPWFVERAKVTPVPAAPAPRKNTDARQTGPVEAPARTDDEAPTPAPVPAAPAVDVKDVDQAAPAAPLTPTRQNLEDGEHDPDGWDAAGPEHNEPPAYLA